MVSERSIQDVGVDHIPDGPHKQEREDAERHVQWLVLALKFLVALMLPCCAGRLYAGDFWGTMNALAGPVIGLFLLKDESAIFGFIYRRLANVWFFMEIADGCCGAPTGGSFEYTLVIFTAVASFCALGDVATLVTGDVDKAALRSLRGCALCEVGSAVVGMKLVQELQRLQALSARRTGVSTRSSLAASTPRHRRTARHVDGAGRERHRRHRSQDRDDSLTRGPSDDLLPSASSAGSAGFASASSQREAPWVRPSFRRVTEPNLRASSSDAFATPEDTSSDNAEGRQADRGKEGQGVPQPKTKFGRRRTLPVDRGPPDDSREAVSRNPFSRRHSLSPANELGAEAQSARGRLRGLRNWLREGLGRDEGTADDKKARQSSV